MCHPEEESATVKTDDIELGIINDTPCQLSISKKPPEAVPFFIIIISLMQILCTYFGNDLRLYLCYDPHRRHEIWRFLTIMLIHSSWSHLIWNLFYQLILGVLLEIVHQWKRIGIIYMCGVLGGTLFVTIITPEEYGVGASAGVSALLFAHVATILLNWNEMDYKFGRVFWLCAYITFDIGQSIYDELIVKTDSNVSHAGHFGGAVTGFLISILVLKNFVEHPWEKRLKKVCAGILISLAVLVIIVNISFPSYYSKSEFSMRYEETILQRVYKEIDASPSPSNNTILKSCLENNECARGWAIYKNETRLLP